MWKYNKENKLTKPPKNIKSLYDEIIKIPDLHLIFNLNKKGFVYDFSFLKKKILSDFFICNKKAIDELRFYHWENNEKFKNQLIKIMKNVQFGNKKNLNVKSLKKQVNIDKKLLCSLIKCL